MTAAASSSDDRPLVLLVDDEVRSQEAMRRTLDEEFRILAVGDTAAARGLLEQQSVAVILCDQRMPGQSGVEFLREARERWPEVVRIVISGYADSEDIIAGVNEAGIFRYVLKPWLPGQLLQTVRDAVEARVQRQGLQRVELDLRAGQEALRTRRRDRLAEARSVFGFDRLVRAPGSPLDALCELADRVARHDLPVLLQGEPGSGKELLARALHYASGRSGGPFVVEHCAAVPDALLEDELYGCQRRGAEGSAHARVGLFQRAHGGTLFLDGIADTSPGFQVRLLRVLQTGEVRPAGAAHAVAVDVRVLAASARRLDDEVRAGRFREDLYWRLGGITLQLPPLRERPGDIVPIAERLLPQVASELGAGTVRLDDDARAVLVAWAWPGNVRELRHELVRAVALAGGPVLRATDFSPRLLGSPGASESVDGAGAAARLPASGTLQERLDAIEAMVLREVMLRLRWNKTAAAKELGLSRVGLRAKLLRFGLEAKS
jgi:two-component system response regulator HupR/HoxA